MRTDQVVWLVGIVTALLLLGLITLEVRLLALAVPLLVYLAVATAFQPAEPRFRVERSVDRETAFEGEALDVAVTVENRGATLEFVEMSDEVPQRLEVVRGSNYLVTQLLPRESLEFRYRLHLAVKGRYTLGPLRVRSRDLLGLFVSEVTQEEALPLTVFPRTEDLRKVQIPARSTRPWLGQIPSRSAGPGPDFWAIRDYVSGDEMRRINWKATSRLDTLLTNEHEGERSGDFVVVLDAREEAADGLVRDSAVEMGVRATISLATKLLEERNRVGLIVMRSVLDWVYPAFGRGQLHRIVEALVTVRPGGEWTLAHVPWILNRFFPPRSQLIIITPLVDRPAREAIAELRAQGFHTLVLSPSVAEPTAEFPGEEDRVRVARAILRLEREANVGQLRSFAPVADWTSDQPLALALKEVWLSGRRPVR